MDITAKLWSYCHILRHDGVDSADYVEQLTYLLFLKMADESDISIPENCRWQEMIKLSGEELKLFYENALQTLKNENNILGLIFQEPISRIQNPASLKKIIVGIESINWTELDKDVQGEAFEGLLEKTANEGRNVNADKFIQFFNLLNSQSKQESILNIADCTIYHHKQLPKKIQKENILQFGKYPIISQSQEEIIGFTDDNSFLFTNYLPVIIFGDHTRVFKYVDYPFAVYGDGVKIIVPKTDLILPKYLFYALKAANIPDLGYSRHFAEVKKLSIVVPSIKKQSKIINKLDTELFLYKNEEKMLEYRKKDIQYMKKQLFNSFFGNQLINQPNL